MVGSKDNNASRAQVTSLGNARYVTSAITASTRPSPKTFSVLEAGSLNIFIFGEVYFHFFGFMAFARASACLS